MTTTTPPLGMMIRSVAILAVVLAAPGGVQADGCKFTRTGRFVPEREQRAMIEWADGMETLYVAALSDPTDEPSVWVVPVRAPAGDVRAEPVDEFPVVGFYEPLRQRARRPLELWVARTAVLNSGGLMCPILAISLFEHKSAVPVKEVSRVEKLGMVVTVVAADSRQALEEYLDGQGVDRSTADLTSLDPYLGQPEYAIVCGWSARPGEPARATGLKLDFPSPTVWFPLRPTRAYHHPVETVVYVRGPVKSAEGCDLQGLRCEYVYGIVEPQSVNRAFADTPHYERSGHYAQAHYSGREELLTRVTLTNDPQAWDQDLELVPGMTTRGRVQRALTEWNVDVGLACSAILGGLLGMFLPRFTVIRGNRRWADYLGGALTGAAIMFTFWASMLVLGVWRRLRCHEQGGHLPPYIALVLLAVVHFLVVLVIYLVLVNGFLRGG